MRCWTASDSRGSMRERAYKARTCRPAGGERPRASSACGLEYCIESSDDVPATDRPATRAEGRADARRISRCARGAAAVRLTIIEALCDPHLFGALPAFRDLSSWRR